MQTGADQRFLVRGLIRGWEFALLILSHFFLKYPMKMNMFGLIETKLFHFHRIFKNGSGEQGLVRANPIWIRHWQNCTAFIK